MRKITLLLLVPFFTNQLFATTYTDKTFLSPNSKGNTEIFSTSFLQKQKQRRKNIRGVFQSTFFYQGSNNATAAGKYFGVTHKGTIQDFIGAHYDLSLDVPADVPINSAYMVHDSTDCVYGVLGETRLDDKIQLRPTQERYGVNLNYEYQFSEVLSLNVSAPVVHTKNSLNARSIGANTTQKLTTNGDGPIAADPDNIASVIDYLSGKVQNTACSVDLQEKLTHAKITPHSTTTEIADIYAKLYYTFWRNASLSAQVNANLIIPTGNKAKGIELWEALGGNGGHYGIGCGLNASCAVLHGKNIIATILGSANVNYLCKETEIRTLGFNITTAPSLPAEDFPQGFLPFGHYYLGAQANKRALFPLANVLTRAVGVTPGPQFDGILNLNLNFNNRTTLDLGYNFFFKDTETVSVKSWVDDIYGLAKWNASTAAAAAAGSFYNVINSGNLTTAPATAPSVCSHKFFAELEHAIALKKSRIALSLGASYELATKNSSLDNYILWSKFSFIF